MKREVIIDDVTKLLTINDVEYKFTMYAFHEAVQTILTDNQFVKFMTIDTERVFAVSENKYKQFLSFSRQKLNKNN